MTSDLRLDPLIAVAMQCQLYMFLQYSDAGIRIEDKDGVVYFHKVLHDTWHHYNPVTGKIENQTDTEEVIQKLKDYSGLNIIIPQR